MKRLIILFIVLNCFTYSKTEQKIVSGAVNITDYQGNAIYLKGKFNPGFKIQVYYLDENVEEFCCPDTFDIRDSWEFTATIKKGCDTLFGKKIYTKPYFGAYSPVGWKVRKPNPFITLKKDQNLYRFSDPLVIQVPSVLTPSMRQKNFEMAMKVFKDSPERSLIFFLESSRWGDPKYKQLAFQFFKKKGYSRFAAYFSPIKDIRNPPINDNQNNYYTAKSGIYGSVVSADGSKIPGVMVTITGGIFGKQTTISSENGNFRFISLPPGEYEIRFELEGFSTVIRRNVRVISGHSVKMTILMGDIEIDKIEIDK
jgi:hypothetical protein